MMIVAGILSLTCCFVLTSGTIYGRETYGGAEWWWKDLFLKFYSPSGRNYFIDSNRGEISLESVDPEDVIENVHPPFISFLSLNLKIYDIYFDKEELNYTPRIVDSGKTHQDTSTFVRHSLHSFVGPNFQVYKLLYNNISDISVALEEPAKSLSHLQIKTLGAYSKWEHTYNFSTTGDIATDISLTPVAISPIRLPEMDPRILKERGLLAISFGTPSGKSYAVTNAANIASVNSFNTQSTDEPYVSFFEPDGKKYDIHFRNDDLPKISPADQGQDSLYYSAQDMRLFSFVGPNKKLYRIDRTNSTGQEVPIIDSSANPTTDVQLTLLVTNENYKKYIKFIFSDEGRTLFDRVEEIDWTPLSKRTPLELEEVETNSEFATTSFLTFYSPSGKNYYLSPSDSSAGIAIAKGINRSQSSAYISFLLRDGRRSYISFTLGDVPSLEIDAVASGNSTTTYSLSSFVAPDRKLYKILTELNENGIPIPSIDTRQPTDPLDEETEECLKISIRFSSKEVVYKFTWAGDDLIETRIVAAKRVSATVIKSLIG